MPSPSLLVFLGPGAVAAIAAVATVWVRRRGRRREQLAALDAERQRLDGRDAPR